jgi:hypothetical protein
VSAERRRGWGHSAAADARKGFAVVALEVKSPANQTEKATEKAVYFSFVIALFER